VLIALGVTFREQLSLASLAARESQLRELLDERPALVYGVAFGVYVAVTGLSLPGAAPLTLVCGWFFGLVRGTLLVSFASTAGATVAMLLSRTLFRDAVQRRFGQRLAWFNEQFDRDGAFFLFSLRLVPIVPFFVINALMGLTRIGVATFWWVSQLGMLAGTVVYVYAGSTVPDLATLADKGIGAVFSGEFLVRLTIAFALLGLLPLVSKKVIERLKRDETPKTNSEAPMTKHQ
jgi:uncharacterized membrane protein YdjX (TVP38/TMEM64 family)